MIDIYIYSLKDPFSNEIKYIGKSNNPKRRYHGHIQDVRRGFKTKKTNWLRKLIRMNSKPILEIIEVCNSNNWEEREIYWINKINPKCNQRKGGAGTEKNNSDYIQKVSLCVLQYDLDLKLINEFKSINEASRKTGIKLSNLSKACNGKLKHASFFIWKFKEKNTKTNKNKIITLRTKKAIEQIDIKSGKIIAEYKSIRDASIINNFNRRAISNCCFKNLKNNYSTSCGYIWKFKDKVYYL